MQQVLLICRPGFETEAGQEVTDKAAALGMFGYFQPVRNSGLVRFSIGSEESPEQLMRRLSLDELVFVRDWFAILGDCQLPAQNRVGAVVDFLRNQGWDGNRCARIEVRLPENNNNRDLGNFSRKWMAPLSKGLRGAGQLRDDASADASARLEILLMDFESAVIGFSLAGNRSPFEGGVPRLRLSASAPSRSALKLEEAWKVFLPKERWLDYLGGGKKAVDLGAAPGGWTWQLVNQGMMVTAVDNGPMQPELMASGHVEHVEADGYAWRPKRAVDWMVCDIVDKPRRTARLVVDWMAGKLCRYAVFNLKLPMKKRYDEWLMCRELLIDGLEEAGLNCRLKARHLYHDREEITCFIERLD
ncbi:23S rRNA (cytidine(2498)-2'-O)-methyltransferase RlmM [Marinobacter halophilus]|uniref:Ribosomal RNA large subunit methyltransferase M n=1 Tax=Marinobacter halophilus TaxID=1323740 RepID=A0A2T1K979_9GAMM|nr:23S rRNA (cytidine(2498)-2'-O)-methyltransferase RlmM [Marinobacter halophilus]PSF06600.1 23S rRNA (cytidine(2498)-2'-O)-methyltransferase RlmM [Marinobacter halophilus]GGC74002.1 ribosomal RNA large subunit methyltransferase M [Marinobacter halophilus]